MTMPDTSYLTSWMNNTTVSSLPTTLQSYWMNYSLPTTFPSFSMEKMMWANLPQPSMEPMNKADITPFAIFYFLAGATFFLGTAVMMVGPWRTDKALDGIATMSDFTKTSQRRKYNSEDFDPLFNRELRTLIHENGMDFDEFLDRMVGNIKRRRTGPFSS